MCRDIGTIITRKKNLDNEIKVMDHLKLLWNDTWLSQVISFEEVNILYIYLSIQECAFASFRTTIFLYNHNIIVNEGE